MKTGSVMQSEGALPVRISRTIVALAVLLVAHAAGGAQVASPADLSDVRIVSSFVAIGAPVPEECHQEAYAFARSLVRYPRPASWHWVLICDEPGWSRFLRSSGRVEGEAIYASTDLTARTTYIRGAKLLEPYDLQADSDKVIAHELAHIWLGSRNEAKAGSLAGRWQKEGQTD